MNEVVNMLTKPGNFESWELKAIEFLVAIQTAKKWDQKTQPLLPACALLASAYDKFERMVKQLEENK